MLHEYVIGIKMIDKNYPIGIAIVDCIHDINYWVIINNVLLFADIETVENILNYQIDSYFINAQEGCCCILLSDEQLLYLSLKYEDKVFFNDSIHKFIEKWKEVKV